MTLGVLLFSAKAQSNDTGLPIRNEPDGKAEIVFGTVEGEEQVIQMSGYPQDCRYLPSPNDLLAKP
jgi:hypothetical protein